MYVDDNGIEIERRSNRVLPWAAKHTEDCLSVDPRKVIEDAKKRFAALVHANAHPRASLKSSPGPKFYEVNRK